MGLQVGEGAREDVAHVDESGVRLPDGGRLVSLVAVLTRSSARPDIGGSDKLDRRTRDRLRRSRSITTALQVDHVRKRDDERLWLPDFVAGSYIGAVSDAGSEPWKIVSESHLTEVIPLDSE